jgi:hypothetical protein
MENVSVPTPRPTKYALVNVQGVPKVPSLFRCRLHVYESTVYDSVYDLMHDVHARHIGIKFFIQHPIPWSDNIFEQKKKSKLTCGHLWQQIVRRFGGKLHM